MKPKRIEECGCCEVGIPLTPEKIKNRPGLAQLSYRVGTYASFRQAIIETIAKSPELRAWTARQSDDYGIALIEMWAYLADILTFYQERIANEAFLRTALHRDTIMRLAAMLDYTLNPGVAATAYLSFLVDKEKKVKIPVGLRVQSVPGQDEKPQKFETIEAVLAEDKLNQIRVFPKPQFYNPFAQGSLGGISISDSEKMSTGDTIVVFDATHAEFKEISDLSVRDDQQNLSWFPEIGGSKLQQFSTRVFTYGQKFQLFGYNAPEYYMEPSTDSDGTIQWTLKKAPNDYNFSLLIPTPSTFSLDAVYDNLKSNSKLLLVGSGSSGDDLFTRMATIKEVTTTPDQFPNQFGTLQGTVTQVSLDMQLTFTPVVVLDHLNRVQVFTIGDDGALWTIRQSAPNDGWSGWASLGGQIDMLAVGKNEDGRLEVFARGMNKALWHIWQLSPGGDWSQWASLGGQIDMLAVGNNEDGRLEVFVRGMNKALWHIWQVAPNNGWSGWASLGGQIDMLAVGNNEDGRLEVFVRGMNKALWHIWQVAPNDGWSGWDSLGVPMWRIPDIRKILIYELTGPSIEFWNRYYPYSISGNTVYAKLDQVKKIDIDRVLIIDDKNTKPEVVTVTAASSVDVDNDGEKDHLAITFTSALTRSFDSLSAQIFGNITKATHGETISSEILGNGNASQTFQEFSLKKSPTTFVPSMTASSGAQNTLELRIGGVLWKEARSLYGQKADNEIYISRIDDEGKMAVQFGDGETGARLPTGQDNVVAKYRQGLGGEGNVVANSITTLLDRPTGLKSVTNPEKATGGTDPESMQDARKNAPNTVRTFERAISLRDYEDLARSYTGIAKAKAVKVFKNENEMIELTITGEKGQRIEINSLTYKNFLGFLDLHRDINHLLEVIPHSNKYLTLKATVQVDPAYLTEDVISAVKKALLKFFDFNNLQLGQGIHLSDIYAVIQAVDGVTAALVDYLDYKASGSPSLNVHLLIEPEYIAALNEADLEILSDLT